MHFLLALIMALPLGTNADYQLGGDRNVPSSVGIVVRDRTSSPLAGKYNVCYVNGFQTQPDEAAFWRKRPRLILRRHGHPVVDAAWGERLLDLRSPRKRHRLAAIVGVWVRGCAAKGFDAVEFDNLDSFTRSHGLLKRRRAIRYARLIVAKAHSAGLAAAQKIWPASTGASLATTSPSPRSAAAIASAPRTSRTTVDA